MYTRQNFKHVTYVIAVFFFLLQSCQKEITDTIPPAPPKPDTLTAGWSEVKVAGEDKLSDIFFTSANAGFLAGTQIYRSMDGGHTWVSVFNQAGIINIFGINDANAYFAENQLWNTNNGGASFTASSDIFLAQDIFFLRPNFGYCTSSNGLFQTNTGGATWRKIIASVLTTAGGYSSLFFPSDQKGWVVASTGIFTSFVNETHWFKAAVTGGSGAPYAAIHVPPPYDTLYVSNYQGDLYKSVDGGTSFSLLKHFAANGFMDIHFIDPQQGYVCIDRFIFATTNGGASWTKVVTVGEGVIHEIHFIDATHGWACADNGTVLIYKP